jgi:hypothetical protein
MDLRVVNQLRRAGFDAPFDESLPRIICKVDYLNQPVPAGGTLLVADGDAMAFVELGLISELFFGTLRPPSFLNGPTEDYEFFFYFIEMTALDYCDTMGVDVRDKEFQCLYEKLRWEPDGDDDNPLFSYLQAAFRLYMSLFNISQAEYQAVARRLARSAKTFAKGYGSTEYIQTLRHHFAEVEVEESVFAA